MIVVTGGAGFIGSALIWGLNRQDIANIVIVDHLDEGKKWRNLVNLDYYEYYDKQEFLDRIVNNDLPFEVDTCIHFGACSNTMERDKHYLMQNNYKYSQKIALWAINNDIRLIYASSAATYGDGSKGYDDAESNLNSLQPLNMYGYSKYLFDRWVKKMGYLDRVVGLKFFNVFGPNEYHKDDMRSMVLKGFKQVRDEGGIKLFESYDEHYADGQQVRDFVYVKDVVRIILEILNDPSIVGIFNVGTGNPNTWNELANAVFDALNKPRNITYIPMPKYLRKNYQYFTQAKMDKLHNTNISVNFTPFRDAIKDYVQNYLVDTLYLDPAAK